MINQFLEQPVPEVNAVNRPPIETASKVIASPDHPQYSADKAVAIELVRGRSGLIAAIDGVGSGGQASAQAAEIVQKMLADLETQLMSAPSINQALVLLKNAIFGAAVQIKELQKSGGNSDVDTTVSAGLICESPDGNRRFLVTANVGDSRVYRYEVSSGSVDQLTVDHSLVQRLVDGGLISPDEAFTHPQRNVVYRTIGSLKAPKDIDFQVTEVHDGDVFLGVSDGVGDNLTPQGLPAAVRTEFQAAYDPTKQKPDLKKFASGLAQRARNIQTGTSAAQAKPDDICVAVLRVPRTP